MESAALINGTFHYKVTATLLDDPINCRHTDARSLAWLFGGEEWLEQSAAYFFGHTSAGVWDRQLDVFPGWNRANTEGVFDVENHVGRRNSQPATARHCIASV